MTKIGDVVTDGCGSLGVVRDVQLVEVWDSRHVLQRVDEQVFVDWGGHAAVHLNGTWRVRP